jgi:hypothetical protein
MGFGHSTIPPVDFCIEVDTIEVRSIAVRASKGSEEEVASLLERIARAMQFRVGGLPECIDAKDRLREIEIAVRNFRRKDMIIFAGKEISQKDLIAQCLAANYLQFGFVDNGEADIVAARLLAVLSDLRFKIVQNILGV